MYKNGGVINSKYSTGYWLHQTRCANQIETSSFTFRDLLEWFQVSSNSPTFDLSSNEPRTPIDLGVI